MPPRLGWPVVLLLVLAALVGGFLLFAASAPKQPDEAEYLYSLIAKDGKLDFSLFEPSIPPGPDEHLCRAIASLLGPKVAHCTLLAEGVCGNKLLRPRLKCEDACGKLHSLIRANEGNVRVQGDQPTVAIHFTDGEIVFSDGRRREFSDKTWLIPLSALRRKQ